MEYFGIDEKILYANTSVLEDNVAEKKSKRTLGILRGASIKDRIERGRKQNREDKNNKNDKSEISSNQLRSNSKKRVERPNTTFIRKEVNAMWNEALKEERNYIREHSPDRVSRITTLSNTQGLGAGNKRYQEPQNFGKRTNMNLDFSIPMPYEKKKGTLFRNSNGNRRNIFSKTWWSNVPIGAYLFFFGFLFPPLWFIGAICKFRKENTVEAEIIRTKSQRDKSKKSAKEASHEWRSKIDKNKTNNGNRNTRVEFSNIGDADPEDNDSWNWGLGGVGNEPNAINVNFMSGIEEYEKHKLAENEKWWRKVNILMSVLFIILVASLLFIYRKSIFGGGSKSSTNSSSPKDTSYTSLNGNNNNNNGNNNGNKQATYTYVPY